MGSAELAWVNKLSEYIVELRDNYSGLSISHYFLSQDERILSETVGRVQVLFWYAIGLTALYSVFVISSCDRIQSRLLLVAGAVLAIACSVVEMVAVTNLLGHKISNFHMTVAFMMIGVGFNSVFMFVKGLENAMAESPENVEEQIR